MTKFLNISTDNTLGGSSASDVLVASQKAVKDYVDLHGGGGGSVSIDGTTITRNGNNEIQASATINGNTASGAANPIYDWVGTLAEYEAQNVATSHPTWLCFITDDAEATAYQAYTQGQCNNLFVQKGHQVIDFQEPTASNNYTWYRKYADGWVEQGGLITGFTNGSNSWLYKEVALPITMSDTNYTAIAEDCGIGSGSYTHGTRIDAAYRATTGFRYSYYNGAADAVASWEVKGMAA